ncbi:FtsK/SpoIIIE domain-containing protein [Kineococcus auxinigenes]|uniref:FtsK/SpoIIIE domain-containing protein n=1 Tax=unclassified Kineococcus TaxID=2621656 RepID=UPI003D7CB10B
MRLLLTLVGAGDPAGTDVLVEAPAGTPLSAVRGRLEELTGPWPGPARAGGREVTGAPLGVEPLLHGAVVDVSTPGPAVPPGTGAPAGPPPPAGAPVALVVVSAGPDAGGRFALLPGRHVVGRAHGAARCAVPLADPGVSRAHAVLEVAADGSAAVHDAGSLNGTALLLPGTRREVRDRAEQLQPGARLLVGASVLHVAPPAVRAAEVRPDGHGHLLLNRCPRLEGGAGPSGTGSSGTGSSGTGPDGAVPRWPHPPPARDLPGVPWPALLVPLGVAVVLALVWSPLSLLLGLASPLLAGGHWWSQRRRARTERERDLAGCAAARERVRTAHAGVLAAEHRRRHEASPGPDGVLAHARARGVRLYERTRTSPDALVLRVGLGRTHVDGAVVRDDAPGPAHGRGPGDAGAAEPPGPDLDDVPITVDLSAGPLGVAGPRPLVLAVVRQLVGQVAAWHGPGEVGVLLTGARERSPWRWLELLPHADPGPGGGGVPATLRAELQRRALARGARGTAASADPPRALVLLVDGAADLRTDADLTRLLRDGGAEGIHVLCLESDRTRLPAECATVLDVAADASGDAVLHTSGAAASAVRVDAVGPAWAEELARALAPVRDAAPSGTGGAVPRSASLLRLLALPAPRAGTLGTAAGAAGGAVPAVDPAALARVWEQREPGAVAVLGATATGPCRLDLVADGPHVLVAGTTGSGKSVLLQALVTSLALQAPPDAVRFVLVDYKGGAAFAGCTGLPHVAGLVTDLDEHLAQRVLRSLRAEVRRREGVLRAAGAADLADLPASSPAAAEVPRLVIVVDEFRVLSQELPEFVDGLVRLAAVGRSLGLHLVLATQRPAGVVSPEIRANTNARIALRVQDRADAEDVVGDAAPAAISDTAPGRAVLRRGSRGLEAFQTALLGDGGGADEVRVRRAGDVGEERGGAAERAGARRALAGVVAAVREATALRGRPVPPAPWSPPLPQRVPAADLPAVPGSGALLRWGLLDVPDEQRRAVAGWDLATGGHLLVAGTVRSGRSTLLRALAVAAATEDVEVSVLDGGGALADLVDLAHVGSVVGRAELWRAHRLLQRLTEEVQRRRELFARLGVHDLAAARRAPGSGSLPHLVLLADGWDGWAGDLAAVELGAPVDAFHRLLREGSAVGVRVATSGDRALLTSPVAAAAAEVVLLRLADRADAALVGVPAREVPASQPPGRGLLVRDRTALEVQVALPAVPPAAPVPAVAAARVRVRPLPASVTTSALPTAVGTVVPLGVGGDDAAPVTVDLAGGLLVCGPARSGRTTALRALAAALARRPGAPPVAVVTADAGARGSFATAAWVGLQDVDGLRRVLAAPGAVVLVDDAARPLPAPVEDLLVEALRGTPGGCLLAAAADGGEVAAAFRGLPAALRTARTTVLLGRGGQVPADVLGRRAVLAPAPGPGAGFVVTDGGWTALRGAVPDGAAAAPTVER